MLNAIRFAVRNSGLSSLTFIFDLSPLKITILHVKKLDHVGYDKLTIYMPCFLEDEYKLMA